MLGDAGLALDVIGFVPNAEHPAEVRMALSWMFGPGVGAPESDPRIRRYGEE